MIFKEDYFIDVEVEGKYKGEKTLFIVDYYKIDLIEDILKQDKDISQIYFGAGYQSEIKNYEVITYFLDTNYIISIEVKYNDLHNIPKHIMNNNKCHKIITLKDNTQIDYEHNNFTFKTENKLGVTCFITPIFNSWQAYKNNIKE